MTKFLAVFLFLGLISIVYAGDGTCWDNNFDSGATPLLSSSCCWYSDDSCCTVDVIYGNDTYDGSSFDNIFLDDYNEFSDGGKTTNGTYQECFTYYEQMFCSVCAPDNSYVSFEIDQQYDVILTVSVCQSFCDNFWNACKDLPLAGEFNGTSTEFCQLFNDDGFVINVASKNCFEGLSSDDVGNSECNPWEDYEGGSGSNNWLYFLFFIALGGLVLVIVVAVVGVVGFMLYKKKQAATFTTNSTGNDYKDAFDDD